MDYEHTGEHWIKAVKDMYEPLEDSNPYKYTPYVYWFDRTSKHKTNISFKIWTLKEPEKTPHYDSCFVPE
jgi:hypothetical protein